MSSLLLLLLLLNLPLLLLRTSSGESPAAAKSATETATTAHLGNRPSRVHDTTVGSPVRGGVERAVGLLVDTEADPCKHTILGLAADEVVSHDRVVTVGTRLEEEIANVLNHSHLVGVVGCNLIDGCDERLVEVDLADVRGTTTGDGVVSLLGSAEVDDGFGELAEETTRKKKGKQGYIP